MAPAALRDDRIRSVIDRLRLEAAGDAARMRIARPAAEARVLDPEARAEERVEIFMAIAPATGSLCYQLIRARRPALVVEFGTSYGVSTVYLGAAVRDNGLGRVVTTELSRAKAAAAADNLADAGLEAQVQVLCGDARETLTEIRTPVGFLFLDGWKELYLPVLRILEPWLEDGALIVADDTSFEVLGDYLSYVRDPRNGYESTPLAMDDGIELTCRTVT
jgi:predicted O-methyltransferase YrrM